ncbi:MAG: hypothetical protein KA146_11920 [Leptospiraceae bacterium]|nr:hypothetical protein [Leptospiraceae bacterium]
MKKEIKLSKSMSETEFENGYWYAFEIKVFSKEIGIPLATKLRKDELEKLIKIFLRTGKIENPKRKNISKSKIKDLEKGLSLNLPIENYTSNRETKDFIVKEALKIAPNLKRKSGVSYRINRWREEQINKGRKITYGDLVRQYVKLNQVVGKFEKVPVVRYINFLSEFLAKEKSVSRKQAIAAWNELKKLNIPKTFEAWKKNRKK